jgi:4-amino-4-deoxy-L-arabinose transferase-like glycosyltransferase
LRRPRFANAIVLCLIVLLALGLRIIFYTGPIGSDDHDYYLAAYEIHEGTYHPSSNYWKTRYGMLLPIAASFKLFGTNEYAAALWPILCSLGAVVLCYFLGREVLDSRTGLLAALLLALYPLDIHYSGLILPDIPLSFLMGASVYAFLRASRSEQYASVLFFLSGILLAIAYSCRSMAVILLPFLLIYTLLFERKLKPSQLLFIAGMLLVISSESLYYSLNGLSPLHNFQLNAKAAIDVNTSGECSTSQTFYPIVVFRDTMLFGPYFFLFAPAMIFSLVKRERGALIFLAWSATILLVLQFGLVSLFPAVPIVKVRKFLNFATVPLIVLAAWTLMKMRGWSRWSIVVLLAGISLYLIRPYSYSSNMTPEASGGNVREVVAYLEMMPPKPIYADLRTQAMMTIASDFELEPDRFRNLYKVSSPLELKHCHVIINKFYSQFDLTNPYATVPDFVANYPSGTPSHWKAKDFFHSVVLDVP